MLNNPAMAQPAVLYGGMMFFGVGVLLSFLRATETIRRRLSQPERA